MAEKKKTYVEDIERTLYDIKNEDHSVYKSHSGLTPEIVRDISQRKHDPAWMTEFRLKSLEVYNSLELPTWGRPSKNSIWTILWPMCSPMPR